MERANYFGENNQALQVGVNTGFITVNQSRDTSSDEIDRLCLRNLHCPDSQLTKNILKETKDKLLPDSFEWILKDRRYRNWRDEKEVCLLWIKGGAGKGKTMIAIGLIEELLRFRRENSSILVTYFFCQNANSEFNTLEGIMKGLIFQLLNQQPALKANLRSRWDTEKGLFDQDLTEWRNLWHILLEMIEQCDCSKIYLVLDALDECRDDQMNQFLTALMRSGLAFPERVKWLLTSRPLDIAERTLLAECYQVQLSLELNSDNLVEAVKSYITHKVNEISCIKRYGRRLKEQAEFQLQKNSEQTFLWVSLVCKRLENLESSEDVLATIQETARGLNPLYAQALKQLNCGDAKKAQMCLRLLKVMMLAYRPLKRAEFPAIAGFENDEDTSLLSLIDSCASFLRLQGQSVEFVHQSARDFLSENDQQLILDSSGIYRHCDIAMNCISYLSRSLKVNLLNLPPSADMKIVESRRADNKSLALDNVEYAAVFWERHFRDSYSIYSRNYVVDKDRIIEFLHAKVLEWLESLSLLNMLPIAMATLQRLENFFKDEPSSLSFVRDSTRFLSRHLHIVQKWPLQVYVSAVIWSPESSVVRKKNLDLVPWLRSVAPLDTTWGPRRVRFPREMDNQVKSQISSDDKLLATVCERFDSEPKSAIYIWDIATGIMQWELPSESAQGIRELGFSQDNKKLIWISKNDAVHSWEILSSRDVHTISVEHPGFGKTVVLSSATMQVASIVDSQRIVIWDTSTGKARLSLSLERPFYDQRLFFSLDDTQIMCDVSDREVCIWDTTTGRLQKTLVKPRDFLHCLAQSPDGTLIAYYSSEAKTFFWDTLSGDIKDLPDNSSNEEDLLISPNMTKFACRTDESIHLWDVTTGRIQASFLFGERAMKMAFSPSDRSLVYLTYDGELRLLDTKAEWEKPRRPRFTKITLPSPMDVAFSHDGQKVVCCVWGGDHFTIRDARTGAIQKTTPVPVDGHGHIITARFLPGDENILVGTAGHVLVWEAATGNFQPQGNETVSTLAPSPDGKYLAGIVHWKLIRIWDMQTRALLMTIEGHGEQFHRLAFSPDGTRIASYVTGTSGLNLTLNIWDISRSLKIGKFVGNALGSRILQQPKRITLQSSTSVDVLEFSVDGQYILSNHGPIMVSDTHANSECKGIIASPGPSLHVNDNWTEASPYTWIFCGQQPFINIPFGVGAQYCLDVQGDKIVIGFTDREPLILDIDTKVLSEILDSVIQVNTSYDT